MTHPRQTQPSYADLTRFLMQPFLDSPEALRIDCETCADGSRIWVRLAFEGADKGRVFGRGGRNIQAVRAVLNGVAKAAGQTANLEIYGGQQADEGAGQESRPRSSNAPKPRPSKPVQGEAR
ncbi:KH domain-containing protein [Myxacorys almedinensis]|uniref:KH domain-containing protein n=1 Tax=Myxacorys almedinensis A TaxID=2690445 RepID=A0A8J8CPP7_9CYAN|nr:KH domain-containing protein [Myxacorys almedinensis]NDJ19772.1 KH domain-containing protein [Myxacorys almedinensis A]